MQIPGRFLGEAQTLGYAVRAEFRQISMSI